MAEDARFRVALTGDFVDSAGKLYFEPAALAALRARPEIAVSVLDTPAGTALSAEVLATYDAVITKRSPIAAGALDVPNLRTIHISRNGVGVDHLDLGACARAGILVTNTPDSVRRPIASAAMCLVLALAHRLLEKDRATREHRWQDRQLYRGTGLGGRTLGVVGAGNIGADLLRLAEPWDMVRLVAHPSRSAEAIASLGAEKVALDELLARADFVVLCCPLNDRTHHMIDARALTLMRPDAYLVNVARGAIVDETALVAALAEGRIAGAGLDVFDPEPPSPDNPLLRMTQAVVTSHNLGFTDESNRLGNKLAAEAVLRVAAGAVPPNVVNRDVLDHPRIAHLHG